MPGPRAKPDTMTMAEAFTQLSRNLKVQAKRPNIYAYVPHAKQQAFHSSTSKKRLYIGGNRSGKTTGGIIEDIWYATGRHPYKETPELPVRGRIVSVDFTNGITKNIIPEISRWCPPSDLRGGSWSQAYNKAEKVLNFANGSFIEFMSYDQDLDKFSGTSRHFVHFDEEPPEDIYTECLARLIDTGGDFWITMTPVEGMTWIFDVLYEPGCAGENGIEVTQVSMTENPHLNEGEVQSFLDALSADERKAREEGKFVQLGGLIYKEFKRELHEIDDIIPPKDWLWVASLDHGFNNPTVWLWFAVSPDGQVICFYEHYKTQWTVDSHAKEVHLINKKLGRPPDYYIGDPSIRNKDPITGTSIHEEYIKYGVPITLANNDVVAGINRVARYLKLGAGNKPNLVFCRRCTESLRELGRYRWKTYANKRLQNKNNAQEIPHKKDDHACDAIRYFIMSRPDLMAGYPSGGDNDRLNNPLGAPVSSDVFDVARTDNSDRGPLDDYASGWVLDEQMGAIW